MGRSVGRSISKANKNWNETIKLPQMTYSGWLGLCVGVGVAGKQRGVALKQRRRCANLNGVIKYQRKDNQPIKQWHFLLTNALTSVPKRQKTSNASGGESQGSWAKVYGLVVGLMPLCNIKSMMVWCSVCMRWTELLDCQVCDVVVLSLMHTES